MHHPTDGTLSWRLFKFSRRWLLIYCYTYCSLWQCIIQRLAVCHDICSNSQGGDYSFIATTIVRSGNASSNGWYSWRLFKFWRRWLLIYRYNYCSLWQCIIQRLALCRDVCSNSQGDYSFIATIIVRSGNASSSDWYFVVTFVQILKEVTTHLSLQLLFAPAMHHPMAGTLSWHLFNFSRWLLIYRYNYCSLWQCIIQQLVLHHDICSNSQGGNYSFIATTIIHSSNASSNGWHFVMTFDQILKEVTTH
jgi:hypothetical protein